MNKLFCLVLLPLLSIPLFAQNADLRGLKTVVSQLEGESAVVGKQYAVLIAINEYRNWMALRNPVKDVKEIREILSRRYFVSDFIELYDKAATKAGIIKLFNKLINDAKPEDSILIFYAGHGHLDKTSNTGFWIPVDGGLDVYEQANWLPNSQIRGFISNMKARHVALIADSCFSGDFLNPTRGIAPTITNEYFKNAYTRISRQVLTSGASESVPDESQFTRQLKLALEGNTAQYLDPLMLYNQIRLGVTQTTPLFGDLKDSGHQEGSSFLLFLKDRSTQSAATGEVPSAAQSSKAGFKLEKVFAKVSIETKTTGTLLLDGAVQGRVPAGRVAVLENLEAGSHELEMRYENGQTEKKPITIESGEPVSIKFTSIFLLLPAQSAAAAEAHAAPSTEANAAPSAKAPTKVSSQEALPDGAPLPQASIKIDGNFDDWKGIPPAFSSAGSPQKGIAANLAIDKVYLAVDDKNLYMRFDIMDPTPSSFLRSDNFEKDNNTSYGLDLENGMNHVIAQIIYRLQGGSGNNHFFVQVGRKVNTKYETTDSDFLGPGHIAYGTGVGNYEAKGSSVEVSFPLDTIKKSLGVIAAGEFYKVTARTGYSDQGTWSKGDSTETKQFTF